MVSSSSLLYSSTGNSCSLESNDSRTRKGEVPCLDFYKFNKNEWLRRNNMLACLFSQMDSKRKAGLSGVLSGLGHWPRMFSPGDFNP